MVLSGSISGSFAPGDLAVWHSGSSAMTWPPDGHTFGYGYRTLTPIVNVPVLVVARTDHHGAIVFVRDKLWWCPIKALKGEPSGSK